MLTAWLCWPAQDFTYNLFPRIDKRACWRISSASGPTIQGMLQNEGSQVRRQRITPVRASVQRSALALHHECHVNFRLKQMQLMSCFAKADQMALTLMGLPLAQTL